VVFYFEFQQAAHHALDLLDPRIAKLNYFAAINANDMVVLFVAV